MHRQRLRTRMNVIFSCEPEHASKIKKKALNKFTFVPRHREEMTSALRESFPSNVFSQARGILRLRE